MSDRLDEFGPATVAVIAFAKPAELQRHRDHLGVSTPLLADPDRQLYRRFELGRGRLRELYRPATLRLYAELIRRGRKLEVPKQDTRQLGGDFVIDPYGRLSTGFWLRKPDDRPSVDELLEAVRRATLP